MKKYFREFHLRKCHMDRLCMMAKVMIFLLLVDFLTALRELFFGKIRDKFFQTVQLGSIDSGIGQAKGLAETAFSVKTSIMDGHQANVDGAGNMH